MDDKSYERYKNWQINKSRYKHESIGLILFFGIGFYVGCKICGFIGGMIGFIVFAILYFFRLVLVNKCVGIASQCYQLIVMDILHTVPVAV